MLEQIECEKKMKKNSQQACNKSNGLKVSHLEQNYQRLSHKKSASHALQVNR